MKKMTAGFAAGLFMFSMSGTADAGWGEQNMMIQPPTGAMALSKAAVLSAATSPAFPMILPVVIDDPVGDHFTSYGPTVDITKVEAGINTVDLTIKINFSADTSMDDVVGYVDLDMDQDQTTGSYPMANYYGATQTIGSEFFLYLFDIPNTGEVHVYDAITGNNLGAVLANISGQSMEITVPLSMLAADSCCNINIGMVLGNQPQPTDFAPDAGYGEIVVGVPVDTTGIIYIRGTNDLAQFKMKGVTDIEAAAYDALDNGLTFQFGSSCDDPIYELTVPGTDLDVAGNRMRYTVGNLDVVRCIFSTKQCVVNIRESIDDLDLYAQELDALLPEEEMTVCLKVGDTTYTNTGEWAQFDSGPGSWINGGSWTKYRKDN